MKLLKTYTVLTSLATSLLLASSQLGSAPYEPTARDRDQDAIYSCALKLLNEAGKSGRGTIKLPALYLRASRDTSRDFMLHALAVMYVESRFNKDAVSPMDARGLMQMTEIAVTEASNSCGLPRILNQKSMHDSYLNVKYGTCYLKLMLDVAGGDWDSALILYNGGYSAWRKHKQGLRMPQETEEYVQRVKSVHAMCQVQGSI